MTDSRNGRRSKDSRTRQQECTEGVARLPLRWAEVTGKWVEGAGRD